MLARHAPLVATLKAGSTRVHLGGTEILEFATGPGFFKVETDKALALVDDAVNVKEIDDARATAQLEAAKAELEKLDAGTGSGRPLAARAAHPARREPARRVRPHDRLSDACTAARLARAGRSARVPEPVRVGGGRGLRASASRVRSTSSSSVAIRSNALPGVSPPASIGADHDRQLGCAEAHGDRRSADTTTALR